jgi:uncharacterized protein YdcH (DUF465 family)
MESSGGQENALFQVQSFIPRSFFMFPEYRDLISQLKTTDHHFSRLFDQHNALDQQIKNMESRIEAASPEEIEVLKKEKLQLKDQLYAILKQAA